MGKILTVILILAAVYAAVLVIGFVEVVVFDTGHILDIALGPVLKLFDIDIYSDLGVEESNVPKVPSTPGSSGFPSVPSAGGGSSEEQPSYAPEVPSSGGGTSSSGSPKMGIPLRFEERQTLKTAWIIEEVDGSVHYYVVPVTLLVYGGSPGVNGYVFSTPTGGRPPPFGITIDPFTGVLHWSGSPLSPPGKYYFDVEVTDGSSTVTRTFSIEIKKYSKQPSEIPDVGPPVIELSQLLMDRFQLPNAKAGQPYGATLYVTGGEPPYWWSLDPDYSADFTLAGLWLDPTKGLIRGTISDSMAGKTIRFAVIATDNTGKVAIGEPIYEIYVEP